MRVPNADRAVVDLRKITDDRLSTIHPIAKNEASVFRAALGLTADDAHLLREWMLRAATDGRAAIGPGDEFGDRYEIDFEVVTTSGRALVRSAWIILAGEDFPRLMTCYVHPI